ncbi:MAG: Gfo/Idh/MocA family oxidoreductase [Bacteroidales bacterium]|nr:Gfo/Idh/MocA family oxidoreductase [Bacteroidales bacterium]
MKKIIALVAVLAALSSASVSGKIKSSVPAKVKNGTICLKTPAREKGQTSALQLRCEPISKVRVGFIGLGMRGPGAVKRFSYIDDAQIVALCDLKQENVSKCQKILSSRNCPEAREYVGDDAWKRLCESDDIDLVYICTDWVNHTPMAVYAMNQGKHVAVEVPAAMSIAECWDLVNTCEKTRRHCMMLENCVYDFFEMSVLNMAQNGVFGEVYYGEGGYIHNLTTYWDKYYNNWRLAYNNAHRGDNYPTHGIGPLCQVFGIHRGDRMTRLVSMDTSPRVGAACAKKIMGSDSYAEGDHTTTLIRTHKGKVIEIQHNVYADRPYSRLYALTGTEGYAVKYPEQNISVKGEKLERKAPDDLDVEKFAPKSFLKEVLADYEPEFAREIKDLAKKVGGHGGMDFIMDYRLVYCLKNGLPLDEDVYDAAEWSCLTELSRLSIENGNIPVEVPDFTRGEWNVIDGFSYAMAVK